MSLEALVLLVAFLGLLALPLMPGFRELWRPRDNQPIDIDPNATANPREAGLSFRQLVRPLLAPAGAAAPAPSPLDAARPTPYEVHQDLRVPPDARRPVRLLALGGAEIGDRADLADVYVDGPVRAGADVRFSALAAEGDLTLGARCVVEEWVDTETTAWIGPGCELGRSASAGRELHLGAGCVFRRLWGLPISTETAAAGEAMPEAAPGRPGLRTIDDVVVWAGRRLTLPAGLVLERDLVVYGEVEVGAGSVIRGTIKAHGAIQLAEGVQVDANLICRRDVRIAGGARIGGNVVAEGDVFIGPGTQIGQKDGFKSVYATGRVTLSADVLVFGRVVAERGGSVA